MSRVLLAAAFCWGLPSVGPAAQEVGDTAAHDTTIVVAYLDQAYAALGKDDATVVRFVREAREFARSPKTRFSDLDFLEALVLERVALRLDESVRPATGLYESALARDTWYRNRRHECVRTLLRLLFRTRQYRSFVAYHAINADELRDQDGYADVLRMLVRSQSALGMKRDAQVSSAVGLKRYPDDYRFLLSSLECGSLTAAETARRLIKAVPDHFETGSILHFFPVIKERDIRERLLKHYFTQGGKSGPAIALALAWGIDIEQATVASFTGSGGSDEAWILEALHGALRGRLVRRLLEKSATSTATVKPTPTPSSARGRTMSRSASIRPTPQATPRSATRALPEREDYERFLAWASGLERIVTDADQDGYIDSMTTIEKDSVRWSVDRDQDGVPEYVHVFRNDGLESCIVKNDVGTFTYRFEEYPFVESVDRWPIGGGRTLRYRLLPERLRFPLIRDFPKVRDALRSEKFAIPVEALSASGDAGNTAAPDATFLVTRLAPVVFVNVPLPADRNALLAASWKVVETVDRDGSGKGRREWDVVDGVVTRLRIDSENDEKWERVFHFERDAVVKIERDLDGDGRYELIERYEHNRLAEIILDRDNNGDYEHRAKPANVTIIMVEDLLP